LSKRLHNQNPSRDPVFIPSTVTQHLAHWTLGSHPGTYDWLATENALEPEEELDEESQQQREKERKKRERRERRQQRENELMKAKAESQLTMFPRSSPGPSFGNMASSSQVPSQTHGSIPLSQGAFGGLGGRNMIVPQSQVESGKFGGRPDKKKKKKGRIVGF
jgi:RNA polymerase I-specific transcription initiation factor RRN6